MHVLAMPSPPSTPEPGHFDQARHAKRKRIPEVHDGDRERLSKRLSLLRLEQQSTQTNSKPKREASHAHTTAAATAAAAAASSHAYPVHPTPATTTGQDEAMQLDDSKHKIYIHNIDDELSSDSEREEGRLLFLPDLRKHLRQSSIPRRILANDDGELAGMQLVLYREPKALSVPEEHDGVRKAVREARQRLRDRQTMDRRGATTFPAAVSQNTDADEPRDANRHADHDVDNDDYDQDDDDAMDLD